jgi:pimeloyl-ACP methyl ester carboxylesterase
VRPVETRYARSGEIRIAYQVVGQGSLDLVLVPGFISNLDVLWEDPGYSRLVKRLSAFSRLILFDKRGTGLSDRVDAHAPPDFPTRTDDIRAVMDAAGCTRAALLGASEGAAMSVLFAATYPERVRALVLHCGYVYFDGSVMDQKPGEVALRLPMSRRVEWTTTGSPNGGPASSAFRRAQQPPPRWRE